MGRKGETQLIYWFLIASALALVLWVAYRIGRIVLRIAMGLAFLAFITASIWYIFLR